MKHLALAVLAVLMFVPAALADSVITAIDIVVTNNAGQNEIISFTLDLTTGTLDSLTVTGPEQGFVLESVTSYSINFLAPDGALIQLESNPGVGDQYPALGDYPDSLISMYCSSPEACYGDGFFGITGVEFADSGTLVIASPEPGTLAMLLAGICLVGLSFSFRYNRRSA